MRKLVWRSECKQYRVIRYIDCLGKRYYAIVKSLRFDGKSWWDFAVERRAYKKKTAAIKACEINQKLWRQFLQCDGKRAAKALIEKSIVFQGMPLWVSQTNHPLVSYLSDPTRTSLSSSDDNTLLTEEPATPAPSVGDTAGSTRKKTGTSSKATSSRRGTSAKSAGEQVKDKGNPSMKNTKKSSDAGKSKSSASKPKKSSGKKRSGSSPAKSAGY